MKILRLKANKGRKIHTGEDLRLQVLADQVVDLTTEVHKLRETVNKLLTTLKKGE